MSNVWQSISQLVGGLGLFLLGMSMMTDGLKLAAGPALHNILSNATRTRWHALGSGAMVTAMVQSSTAVSVAAIGFVNAGLLGLAPAVWVVFGANVGTTMTSWIVALVGLKFKVEALALPLVGLGTLMRITGEHQRRGALGTTLAGFGLLFLGIGLLQQTFVGLADQVSLPQGTDAVSVLAQLGIGLMMTVMMKSSSAAMTITLTAAQSGLIGPQGAAAVVIGANIGSAVTTALVGIGATPNARRTAAAHVIFNLLTGTVALLLLPWLIGALSRAGEWLDLPHDPATKLALFHTTFNLLGVLLMWPLADRLTRWLLQRFRAREEDEAQPRFLDDNVLAVPTLALDALEREVTRFGQLCVRMARAALGGAAPAALASDQTVMTQLDAAVETFAERLSRSALSTLGSERLAELLRIQRYYETCARQALAATPLQLPAGAGAELVAQHQAWVAATQALLTAHDEHHPAATALDAQTMEQHYQALKAGVLAAAAAGVLPLADMEALLGRYSALRRAVQQAIKARVRLHTQDPS
ncbi:MAG: Na/Pi symporter [Hydrogenophaga sp.]|uniref:Na/Pi cotransporter family protein n=1 Tax=Hydrogenophaga sp. TaxID=1904254 RepID=UPI002719729F|nr:Na/Pi symporter [Hydrogenophaga sp.]MDO9482824.1 Na/Pi symporter [Hydrogenophaga sp.]MDP3347059.1 Na/Pi symporter [Hydrogenophaga sp.]MDP3806462.1 Na/Pi symporter [Hydrogenophaga sp.]